ncbi:MAG: TetR/AcrR family transcriptional regulator [Proteobacteria bacterium]|nr:TetR/AcrR family transcriptional regulator [Pseudomonadota bacterium]
MSTQPQSSVGAPPRAVGSRREDGKARVRAGLLSVARRLFARRGVAETTMDDIARLAGVSRATAFNYFPSKNLLLAALVHEMEARFVHLIDRQLDQPGTAAERIAALFTWTAAKVEETPELSRVLIGASETTFGAAPDSAVRTEQTHQAFTRLLEQGRRDGNVRADVPTEVLAEIVGGTYAGILHAWRVGARYPLRRRLDLAAATLGELICGVPRAARRGGAR